MENTENKFPLEKVEEMEKSRQEALEEADIDESEVLEEAKDDLNCWNNYFNDNIMRSKSDMDFALRDQWTNFERSEFTRLMKTPLTVNKIYDPVKKIVGEQRQNKPDLIVRSLTGKATQEQIDLRADLVRTIAYQSQNNLVYQQAFECALLGGFGAFQIIIDYENPKSFRRVIRYQLIQDITKTSFDPIAIMPHKGDGNFCSNQYGFTRKQFDATYPYIKNPSSYVDPRTLIGYQFKSPDNIIMCDYFKKDWFPVIIYQLSDGRVVTEEEWKEIDKMSQYKRELASQSLEIGKIIENEIPRIIMERQTQDYKIRHYRLLKDQIIEFSDWPSKYLPIIFTDGDSHFIEGQQYTRSFIKDVKDVQKAINYEFSEMVTEIKNRRREQWIGTMDNIVGQEQMWRNPEQQIGILIAKPDPKTGQMPQKSPPWELSQGILQLYQRNTMDIREVLGFSENEGPSNADISGRAKRERRIEASMSSYVYQDNLNQAIEQGGRVVLDLLPVVYGDDERHMILSKADGKSNSVVLNKTMDDGTVENSLEGGDYDIEIDAGPSFAVQKEMALEMFSQVLQVNPQAFNLIADLWAKNMDVQFMPQIVERFKTLVPPQILAKEAGQPAPPQQPNPQAQMMQAQMQFEAQKIKQKDQELQIKQAELQLEKEKQEIEASKDKLQMMIDIHTTQEESHMNRIDKSTELHKAQLDYNASMAKVMASLHKPTNILK